MNNTTSLKHTLIELESLLRRCRSYGWANKLERLLGILDIDSGEVLEELSSTEYWGGAGSLLDVYLSQSNHNISHDFLTDNQELNHQLIDLINELRQCGYDRDYLIQCEISLKARA